MLAVIAILIFIMNIPFGIWRKLERRFSIKWFLAIHIPVALSVFMRYIYDMEFSWEYILLFVSVFIAGQYTGKLIYTLKLDKKYAKDESSNSC